MSTPAHRQVFDPASADEPVTFADLKRFAESNVRATGTLLRETFGKFEDRLTKLETSSDVKTIQRDAHGRAERLLGGTTDAVQLRDLVASLGAEVARLRATVAALEAQVKDKVDRGVWQAGETYRPGNGVTYRGSYWIAQRDSHDKPGESDAWRLAVKRGRDGKDGARGPEGKVIRVKE